jgi:hypothetical protein|tara:strand:+ start:151 stop:1035 length:885 start_codon:yes stop_codon:yes gene_type:complete
MKAVLTLSISLVLSSISYSQIFYSDFEDGTLQGWTNIDTSTIQLTVEGNSPSLYLQKECDGTNSPIGEMTIINTSEWVGNYFYESGGNEETLINIDEIYMKNDNDFDLYLRYGFTGANGYMVVTTDPIIVPALSDWNIYEQYFNIQFPSFNNLTIINDTTGLPFLEIFNNVHDLFEDVVEFKIFHNENTTFEGENLNGTLQIGDIFTYIFLSNEEENIDKVQLYPNPTNNILKLKLPNESDGSVEFFNVLGENVLSKSLSLTTTQINVSKLKSGIYLVRIQTKKQSIVKKLVKI